MRRAFVLGLMGLLALAGAARAEDAPLGKALAGEVREIFRTSCIECHGADLASPDGEFGYVLDLPRIAANPDMVVPGDPAKSEIYLLVLHDEMPGEDSDHGPLSLVQKETIRRWIELGALAPDPVAAVAGAPADTPAAAAPTREPPSAVARTLRWLGEFHGPAVHFPVALLVVAALAQGLGSIGAMVFCLRVAAVTAPLAAALGWANAEFASFTAKSATLLAWHRWLGVAVAVLAILASALARKPGPALRPVLILGAILVLVAGALGGGLSHGFGHYAW
ncbi:MAG TPA: c-type cytochrome domain-containing protein [Opitutaceae bacterium]